MGNIVYEKYCKIQKLIGSYNLPQKVTIIAVSKGQPLEVIKQLIDSGINNFAENYIIEAEQKWIELKKQHPNIILHLVGHLQSNKIGRALEIFDVIHSIDRISLIQKLVKCDKYKEKKYFIQIKLDSSGTYGISEEQLPTILDECNKYKLNVVGFMGITPLNKNPDQIFAKLEKISSEYNFSEISAGMSSDFISAIRHGSTNIRIGTAIFGERQIIKEQTRKTTIPLYLILEEELIFNKISGFIKEKFPDIEILSINDYNNKKLDKSITVVEQSKIKDLKTEPFNPIILINKYNCVDSKDSHLLYLPLRLEDLSAFIEQQLLNITNDITIRNINLKYNNNVWIVTNTINNFSTELTEKEGFLLKVLLAIYPYHSDKETLLKEVWQIHSEGVETHTLESHVSSLRKKLANLGENAKIEIEKHENGYLINMN